MELKQFAGIDISKPEYECPPNAAIIAENVSLRNGTIKTISGYLLQTQTPANEEIHTLVYYRTPLGDDKRIALSNNQTFIEAAGTPIPWAESLKATHANRIKCSFRNTGTNSLVGYPVRQVLSSTFDYISCLPSGTDIRVMSVSGVSLPFWIETWNPVGESIIKIKMDIPATSIVTYFIYYGSTVSTTLGSSWNAVYEYEYANKGCVNDNIFKVLGAYRETTVTDIPFSILTGISYQMDNKALVDNDGWHFSVWKDRLLSNIIGTVGINARINESLNTISLYKTSVIEEGGGVANTFLCSLLIPLESALKAGDWCTCRMNFVGVQGYFDFYKNNVFICSKSFTVDFLFTNTFFSFYSIEPQIKDFYIIRNQGLPTSAPVQTIFPSQTQAQASLPYISGTTFFQKYTDTFLYSVYSKMFFVDHTQPVKLFNGTDFVNLGLWVDGTHAAAGTLWQGENSRRGASIVGSKERVFIGQHNGVRIWYSNLAKFENDVDWKKDDGKENSVDVPALDGDTITGMRLLFDKIIIWTQHNVFCLSSSDPATWEMVRLNIAEGCIAPRSIAGTGTGYYFASNTGIHYLTGQTLATGAAWGFDQVKGDSISAKITLPVDSDLTVYSFTNINKAKILDAQGVYYNQKYLLSYNHRDEVSDTNNAVLCGHEGDWTVNTDIGISSFCLDTANNFLYAGGYHGEIFQIDKGVLDMGELPVVGHYQSVMNNRGTPAIKRWKNIWVTYTGEFLFECIVDGVVVSQISLNRESNIPLTTRLRVATARGVNINYRILNLVGEIFSIVDEYETYRLR